MEEAAVAIIGDHLISSAMVTDEVEIKEEETGTFAETRDRSMSDGALGDCSSVQLLNQLIQQHKSVYRKETLSKHFRGDVLKVAIKCWEQISGSMHTALEAKFASVLEEFSVRDKLTEMDKLWDENDHNEAAWRPSGSPDKDCVDAEGVVVRQQVIPRFQEELKQVNSISAELQQVLKERRSNLKSVESDVQTLVNELGEFVGTL